MAGYVQELCNQISIIIMIIKSELVSICKNVKDKILQIYKLKNEKNI